MAEGLGYLSAFDEQVPKIAVCPLPVLPGVFAIRLRGLNLEPLVDLAGDRLSRTMDALTDPRVERFL